MAVPQNVNGFRLSSTRSADGDGFPAFGSIYHRGAEVIRFDDACCGTLTLVGRDTVKKATGLFTVSTQNYTRIQSVANDGWHTQLVLVPSGSAGSTTSRIILSNTQCVATNASAMHLSVDSSSAYIRFEANNCGGTPDFSLQYTNDGTTQRIPLTIKGTADCELCWGDMELGAGRVFAPTSDDNGSIGITGRQFNQMYSTKLNLWTLPTVDGTCGQQLTTNGCAVLSFAAASSGEFKNDLGSICKCEALNTVTSTPVHRFTYDEDSLPEGQWGCLTHSMTGIFAEEAPWAMQGKDKQAFSPINTSGYLMASIQALSEKVERLENSIIIKEGSDAD